MERSHQLAGARGPRLYRLRLAPVLGSHVAVLRPAAIGAWIRRRNDRRRNWLRPHRRGGGRRHGARTDQDDQTRPETGGTGRARQDRERQGELTWHAWWSIPSAVSKAISASKRSSMAERFRMPGAPAPCSAASS